MFLGGQNDPTVTPAYLNGLWTTLPATTQRAWVEIAGADHLFFTRANSTEGRLLIPWLKTFLDNDTRYPQFLCPHPADMAGISNYRSSCPLVPPGAGPSPSPSSPSPPPSPPTGLCGATYRTVSSWPGGFQGEVIVTAGASAISGWTVRWDLANGQTITQVWNGTLVAGGSSVSVSNVAYNGSVPAGGSATFGFLGNGTASSPVLTCISP